MRTFLRSSSCKSNIEVQNKSFEANMQSLNIEFHKFCLSDHKEESSHKLPSLECLYVALKASKPSDVVLGTIQSFLSSQLIPPGHLRRILIVLDLVSWSVKRQERAV